MCVTKCYIKIFSRIYSTYRSSTPQAILLMSGKHSLFRVYTYFSKPCISPQVSRFILLPSSNDYSSSFFSSAYDYYIINKPTISPFIGHKQGTLERLTVVLRVSSRHKRGPEGLNKQEWTNKVSRHSSRFKSIYISLRYLHIISFYLLMSLHINLGHMDRNREQGAIVWWWRQCGTGVIVWPVSTGL